MVDALPNVLARKRWNWHSLEVVDDDERRNAGLPLQALRESVNRFDARGARSVREGVAGFEDVEMLARFKEPLPGGVLLEDCRGGETFAAFLVGSTFERSIWESRRRARESRPELDLALLEARVDNRSTDARVLQR